MTHEELCDPISLWKQNIQKLLTFYIKNTDYGTKLLNCWLLGNHKFTKVACIIIFHPLVN